jgi:guanine deaminase
MTTPGDLNQVFKGIIRNPVTADRVDVYDPGYLIIAGSKIEELTREDPRARRPSFRFTDLGDKTILPGFIDTHVHLPQFAIMGVGGGQLLDWLENYTFPEEARFADSEYAGKISQAFFDNLVANGTTTAVIYSSVHEEATRIAFRAAQAKGIRAFIGKVMMDRHSPYALLEDSAESIAASLRLFDAWDGAENGRLRYIFTPRYAGSSSMELMKRVGELALDRRAFLQSHLSENLDEVRWIRSLFPEHPSYAAVYDAAGLLGERTIMGHCIHLSPDEISLLSRTRTNVAFCPGSNRNLHSGTMPYRKLRDAGLNISLATDVAGGPSLSMLDQMEQAVEAAKIPSSEALYLATLAGAKALGLADRVGNFEPGKDADFVIIEERTLREVYVRGKVVYFKANHL